VTGQIRALRWAHTCLPAATAGGWSSPCTPHLCPHPGFGMGFTSDKRVLALRSLLLPAGVEHVAAVPGAVLALPIQPLLLLLQPVPVHLLRLCRPLGARRVRRQGRGRACTPRGAVCTCVRFFSAGSAWPCDSHALLCAQESRSWKLLFGYTILLLLDIIHRSILLLRMHVFLSRSLHACVESHPDVVLLRQIDSSLNADTARERRSSCP
jgi:hypothetical protein